MAVRVRFSVGRANLRIDEARASLGLTGWVPSEARLSHGARETVGRFAYARPRPSEISAHEQQWHAGGRRDRVRHAVPKIQARGVTSPSKPQKCGHGGIQMFLVECDHLGFEAAQESEKQRTASWPSRVLKTIAVSSSVGTPTTTTSALSMASISRSWPGSFKWMAMIAELSRTLTQ